eukprot:gene6967-11133_t
MFNFFSPFTTNLQTQGTYMNSGIYQPIFYDNSNQQTFGNLPVQFFQPQQTPTDINPQQQSYNQQYQYNQQPNYFNFQPNEPKIEQENCEELYSINYHEKELKLQLELYQRNIMNFYNRVSKVELPEIPSSSYTTSKNQPTNFYLDFELKENYNMFNVLSDGNCLYRAISLTLFGTEKYHVLIRLYLIKEMSNEKKFYIQLLKKMNINYLNILKSTLELSSWGTEVHIYILSNALKRKIVLYDGYNSLQLFHQFCFTPVKMENEILRIHWSNSQHVHFNALLPKIYNEFINSSIPNYGENVINDIE